MAKIFSYFSRLSQESCRQLQINRTRAWLGPAPTFVAFSRLVHGGPRRVLRGQDVQLRKQLPPDVTVQRWQTHFVTYVIDDCVQVRAARLVLREFAEKQIGFQNKNYILIAFLVQYNLNLKKNDSKSIQTLRKSQQRRHLWFGQDHVISKAVFHDRFQRNSSRVSNPNNQISHISKNPNFSWKPAPSFKKSCAWRLQILARANARCTDEN